MQLITGNQLNLNNEYLLLNLICIRKHIFITIKTRWKNEVKTLTQQTMRMLYLHFFCSAKSVHIIIIKRIWNKGWKVSSFFEIATSTEQGGKKWTWASGVYLGVTFKRNIGPLTRHYIYRAHDLRAERFVLRSARRKINVSRMDPKWRSGATLLICVSCV